MTMRKPSLYIKRVTFTLLFITFHSLPYVICTECGCQSPPSPAPAPAPKPSPPPLIFADVRLARVYPIIQTFKSTITCDPLGVTQNWSGSDICSYNGFYCDNPPDNLTATALAAIDFNGFQLCAPTLDPFIGNLPDLAFFHANTNNFTGSIPANISNLPYLYELDLSNNKFSGQFPTAVLAAIGLTFLDLRYNFFTGSVPPQIFMQTLDVLFINNNNFMQRLPQNLGATSALFLTLANNKFTGPIPRSIGKASATLTEILLLNNQLTGCLPYELGFLRNATLIDVGNNRVTGPLPWSLGCLEKVEQLNFAGNLLYGQVPDVVCALGLGLGNLVNLSLSDNYFTNVGPLCWKLIKSGVLDVRRNCIPWLHDQRSTAECWGFFWHHYGYCPYLASYSFIPCHQHLYRSTPRPPLPPPPSTVRPGRHLISYSAVRSRHRVSRSWGSDV